MVPMLMLAGVIGLQASSPPRAQDKDKAVDPVRSTISRAINWIARQAVPLKDESGGVLFPESAETPERRPPQIYGGTAGVLIFLENAAAVLNDARARALADATVKGLLATRIKTDEGTVTWMPKGMLEGSTSLYMGDAGIGHAFLTRARIRNDDEALAIATEVGDSIIARGKRNGDQLYWDHQVEMIFGASGTILFLLELGEETKEERFIEAALAASRWLIAQAKSEPGKDGGEDLLSWRWQLGGNMPYVNFSHGTAGVAYALARVAGATDDADCARAARGAAEWLIGQSIHQGDDIAFPVMANTKMTMGGWCHGPPGTARLFLLLHRQTGEQRYLDVALASARWVMSQAPSESKDPNAPPPAIPSAFCCGVSGVLDFFCDLYRVTKKPEFAAFARRAGAHLIRIAKDDGDGVKWAKGKTEFSSGETQHGIDLMLGAAGEGMALLRLATIDQEKDPVRHLPDRTVRP
jgi:lantibiotic modifying enzyme